MTHAHIDKQQKITLESKLNDLSNEIGNNNLNDESQDMLYTIVEIFRHELERMLE